MANIKKGEYTIKLDRVRTLKLTFNALCSAELELGHTVIQQNLGLRDVRAILWAAMEQDDPKITVEEVGKLITSYNMKEVLEVTAKVLGDFFAAGEVEGTGDTQTGTDLKR